ncbi:MAG: S8 family peptidase [Bryobacteraceae bacterium]|nr:S8 family peptidase [Bryobacterales bacterium]MEB2362812.1 S8 family peptidase [Bryobacterales bacterium]NUN01555.1 S8 family peptidase [Bryobacteraceae bacterium]
MSDQGAPPPLPPKQKFVEEQPLRAGILSEAFYIEDQHERDKLGMPPDDLTPTSVVVELNLFHEKGLPGARERFHQLHDALATLYEKKPPLLIANTYYRCYLSIGDARDLASRDQSETDSKRRCIYRIWPDFRLMPLINRSVATVKADAARRAYDASGNEIVWAVIDSGIQADHPHFQLYETLGGEVSGLHRDFTKDEPDVEGALIDKFGHGTHVAGIIAGALCRPEADGSSVEYCMGQRMAVSPDSDLERLERRTVRHPSLLSGVAPLTKLISLKVLDDNGRVRSTDVLRALEYIRSDVNGHGKPPLRVHGVNISLGYEFNAKWFACGQSPVCIEVDRLVRSGVAVVIAAGNTGYGELMAKAGPTNTGLSLTINDPGNAALAITVGSTHKDSPHTYGVSYFSSKGPTGDGRLKPDLVAPGERIVSCATGKKLELMKRQKLLEGVCSLKEGKHPAAYIDESGTSMAAPHVSGAIAAFLSIRREFIGKPEDVKRIFLNSATSLGRERYFEGSGLVDLMRAIQSI